AVAPFRALRHPPLARGQGPLGSPAIAWRADARSNRQRGERLSTEIKAGLLPRRWQWVRWYLGAGEGDVPAVGLATERDHLGRALNRTRPRDVDTPNLGEHQMPVIQPRAVAVLLEGE
ncbi:MAG TPA: hypothetical protein VGP82_16790, partial [Ktedonobacterales bacterium]|nr:hypothetical protein [Ktedonobacterales bacterium]